MATPQLASKECKEMIKRFEGCSLVSYKDAVGIWTIGYGHTPAQPNQAISAEEAEHILDSDVEIVCSQVLKLVKVPLNQSQLDALISFTFNLGAGNLRESTLLEKLNAGRPKEEVAIEFLKWIKAGGNVLPGLVKRRAEENALFLKDS